MLTGKVEHWHIVAPPVRPEHLRITLHYGARPVGVIEAAPDWSWRWSVTGRQGEVMHGQSDRTLLHALEAAGLHYLALYECPVGPSFPRLAIERGAA